MERKEWLDGLKTGDEVVMKRGGTWPTPDTIERVTHHTKTQIVLGRRRFGRKDGMEMGQTFRQHWIEEATPERRKQMEDEHRRREHIAFLRYRVEWSALDDETLAAVVALVEAKLEATSDER